MIGDTSFDMTMGVAAGARAIGVDWGYHAPDELRAAGAETVVGTIRRCSTCCREALLHRRRRAGGRGRLDRRARRQADPHPGEGGVRRADRRARRGRRRRVGRQGETLDPRQMPLTGFAYAAIDRVAPDRPAFAADLARFAETELLCYRADAPAPLVARQAEEWDPLLAWAAGRYDVAFTVTAGILHTLQPPATMARINAAFAALDAFRLAALHPVVTICGSALIGLAVSERHLDADAAFAAGQLDELWQAEKWGIDPLAAASLAARRAAVDTAVEFLDLIDS